MKQKSSVKQNDTVTSDPRDVDTNDDVTKSGRPDAYVIDDVTSVYASPDQALVKAWKPGPPGVSVKPIQTTSGQYETGHQTYMVLSVVVSVCFNLPMGLLAFFVSVKSSKSFKEGNIAGGRARARCSLVLSMMGIVVTVTVVMAVVFYIANKHRQMQYSYG